MSYFMHCVLKCLGVAPVVPRAQHGTSNTPDAYDEYGQPYYRAAPAPVDATEAPLRTFLPYSGSAPYSEIPRPPMRG